MTTVSQKSFAGGELAPALYARVDTTKYATGLRTCRNFFVMKHGGVATRPGTKFIAEVKDSSKATRLIPWIFNDDDTYLLEFGDGYLRTYQNDDLLVSTSNVTITNITNANPAVLTYTGLDPTNTPPRDEFMITGVVGAMASSVNGKKFKIANINTVANTLELRNLDGTNFNSTSIGSYTSGGLLSYIDNTSVYQDTDLFDIQYVQYGDTMVTTHPSYEPKEVLSPDGNNPQITSINFGTSIAAPTGVSNTGAAGSTSSWVVTAVKADTYEESLESAATTSSAVPSSGSPITISWNAVTGAQEYNVYRRKNGIYGFVGIAGGLSFEDTGIDPDTLDTPPVARNPFSSTNNYPAACGLFQQRLLLASPNSDIEKVYASRSGMLYNFTISSPLQEDDAVTFSMTGRRVNEVRHLLDLGQLVVLTAGGEWTVQGDAAGILKPAEVNPKQYSYNGASNVAPIIIGGNALFIQARGSIVRDLSFDYQVDGYRGNDLTIFSGHLFEGHTIIDWAYQQNPHSIVWAVRDDGVLLALTYVREHEVWGWSRHDFDGEVESVCVIPDGNEDALYMIIKRTIDGETKRYIERLAQRRVDDIIDYIGMDCSVTYDGRNTNNSHTMTLAEYNSGGWLYTSTITCTSSTSYFSANDVGNAIHLTGSDGTVIRFTINEYVSATVVRGKPHMTVPAGMRAAAISNWAKAVDQVPDLDHLEGEEVSVFADGFVVANPNNESYEVLTVTDGVLTLDRPYTVIHVGLPFTCDVETLNIDTAQGETLADKKKIISKVTVHVESSRGVFIGAEPPSEDDDDPLEGLTEYKTRNEEGYDDPPELETGTIDVNIQPHWNSNGRVFIRQIDPIPLSVLAVAPAGMIPFRG